MKRVTPPPPYDKRFQQLLEKYPIVFFCECQRLSSKQALLDRVLFITAHGILMLFTREGLGKRVEALFVPQNVNLLHVHTDETFFAESGGGSDDRSSSKKKQSSGKHRNCKVLLRFREGKDLMFQFDAAHRHATATNLFTWAGHERDTVGVDAQSILGGFLASIVEYLPQKEQHRVMLNADTLRVLDAAQSSPTSRRGSALGDALLTVLRRTGQDSRVKLSIAAPKQSNNDADADAEEGDVAADWSAAFGEEAVMSNLRDDFSGHGPPPAPPPEAVPPPEEEERVAHHNNRGGGDPHHYGAHHNMMMGNDEDDGSSYRWEDAHHPSEGEGGGAAGLGGGINSRGMEWEGPNHQQQPPYHPHAASEDPRRYDAEEFDDEEALSDPQHNRYAAPPPPRVVDHTAAIAAAESYLTSLSNYTMVQRLLRYSESLVDEAQREIVERGMLERQQSMEATAQQTELALEELVSQICHRNTRLRQDEQRQAWERQVERDLRHQRRNQFPLRALI